MGKSKAHARRRARPTNSYSTLFPVGPVRFIHRRWPHLIVALVVTASIPIFLGLSVALAAPTADTLYTDPKLGFSLRFPSGWQAQPQPGLRSSPLTSSVSFFDPALSSHRIDVSVMRGQSMPAAFRQRGTPNASVGGYPAFDDDAMSDGGPMPCMTHVFLAGQDYVVAQWCSPDARQHRGEFAQSIATYRPSSASPPSAGAGMRNAMSAILAPRSAAVGSRARIASGQEDCPTVLASHGGTPPSSNPYGTWGQQKASAYDSRWSPYPLPGAFVCNNYVQTGWDNSTPPKPVGYWYAGYYYQCTELANRFDREQWALPGFDVNAGKYYDYYESGTYHQGRVRTLFPSGSYQLSDDASQGTSSFKPNPGDLLVYQDVNNASQGWTSGLNGGTGHVAVVTGTTATSVTIAQQNYSQVNYFQTLNMATVGNGWHITDASALSYRIVRGWIHFTANNGANSGSAKVALTSGNTFVAIGSTLYKYDLGGTGPLMLSTTTNGTSGPHYIGNQVYSSPITAIAANNQYLFVALGNNRVVKTTLCEGGINMCALSDGIGTGSLPGYYDWIGYQDFSVPVTGLAATHSYLYTNLAGGGTMRTLKTTLCEGGMNMCALSDGIGTGSLAGYYDWVGRQDWSWAPTAIAAYDTGDRGGIRVLTTIGGTRVCATTAGSGGMNVFALSDGACTGSFSGYHDWFGYQDWSQPITNLAIDYYHIWWGLGSVGRLVQTTWCDGGMNMCALSDGIGTGSLAGYYDWVGRQDWCSGYNQMGVASNDNIIDSIFTTGSVIRVVKALRDNGVNMFATSDCTGNGSLAGYHDWIGDQDFTVS
jgi:hypothetical protein